MNPQENTEYSAHWEHITDVVFYVPRTIPAGWDLSEFLPTPCQADKDFHFEFPEAQSNS